MKISVLEAYDVAKKRNLTIEQVEDMFEVTSGAANVEAKAATPEVETKPELVAAAAELFNAGVKRAKTGTGRPKRTLGTKEGTYPYAVSISIDPSYKA